jgi:hypothetical protein
MTPKPVTGTLWVLVTLIGVVCVACSVLTLIGYVTYAIGSP